MNSELAGAFERIADLLEIEGEDAFRISTYRRVSRVIKNLTDDIRVLHQAGVVREIKGIGKRTAGKIEEFIDTGSIELLDQLSRKIPSGTVRLLDIQGMGPKKVAQVYQELGVTGIADLKQAIGSGKLESLPGFGKQSVQRIAESTHPLR